MTIQEQIDERGRTCCCSDVRKQNFPKGDFSWYGMCHGPACPLAVNSSERTELWALRREVWLLREKIEMSERSAD